MPQIKIKTLESKEGWKSDDGEIVSYDLVVEANGRKAQVRTYSKAIAEVGFEGDVETYEKKDHTYLRGIKKEGSYGGNRNYSNNKPAYKDNSDGMRQGMCINNAANYVSSLGQKLDQNKWAAMVHNYATALYLLGDLSEDNIDEAKDEVVDYDLADVDALFKS